MGNYSSSARFSAWIVAGACAVLVVMLAQRHKNLSRAFSELRRRTTVLSPGDWVPTFQARSVDGVQVTVGAEPTPDGRQVIFVFRTTCPYSVSTLPVWQRIADSLGRGTTPPIDVVGISLDSLTRTHAFVEAHGLRFRVIVFPEHRLNRLYKAGVVPQTLVLNGEGRVLHVRTGLFDSREALDSVFEAAAVHHPRVIRAERTSGPRQLTASLKEAR